MKGIFWCLGTLLALGIGTLPEVAMYFTYSMIAPSSEAMRVAVLLGFWFVGGGLCISFGFLGCMLFLTVTKVALE